MQNLPPNIHIIKYAFCSMLTMLGVLSVIFWTGQGGSLANWQEGLRVDSALLNNPLFITMLFLALSTLTLSFIVPGRISMLAAKTNPNTDINFVREIIRMALLESVGLFGFMLGITTQRSLLAIPFIVIAIICILKFVGNDAKPNHGRQLNF